MAKQALDVEFHWVTEHGQDGVLTAGATMKPTVSSEIRISHYHRMLISQCSTILNPALRWTLL
jgi:hypothetical protein